MTVRNLELRDLVKVEKFPRDFPMPDVTRPLYFLQKVVEDEGEVVGAAFAFLTTEITVILKDQGKLEKARAVDTVFDDLIQDLTKRGFQDTHLFVTDMHFVELLKKHYGFVVANGVPLYLTPTKVSELCQKVKTQQ
jgi:hypothetical protein